MSAKRTIKFFFTALTMSIALSCFALPADAAYNTGFKSTKIEITSTSGSACSGSIAIEGLSELENVWSCVRGPAGEIVTYPIKVEQGQFDTEIPLRFGSGKYTIWAGDNPTKFDGTIRFEVTNSAEDNRFTSPSAFVDCESQETIDLANQITRPEMSQREKLQSIHDWVTNNISYDYDAYINRQNEMTLASETLKNKKGMCRDYSFVVAALSRAAGLPAKVVYGDAQDQNGTLQKHAWNEVYVDGRWVTVDATWDAGYVGSNGFVRSTSQKYFDPSAEDFSKTHTVTTYTLH